MKEGKKGNNYPTFSCIKSLQELSIADAGDNKVIPKKILFRSFSFVMKYFPKCDTAMHRDRGNF